MGSLALSFLLLFAGSFWLVPESKAQSAPDNSADGPELRIIFPQDGDTLNVARVRFAGSVSRNAHVRVQGKLVTVFPSGAFVGLVDLKRGLNTLSFETEDERGSATRRIVVFRSPDQTLPDSPTSVDGGRVWPRADIHLVTGEEVEVGFVGSPDGTAFCSISSLVEPVLLNEIFDPRFPGVRGIYLGNVVVTDVIKLFDSLVRFTFQGKDGTVFQFEAPGHVFATGSDSPLVGVTQDSTNFVFDQPGGNLLFELPPGVLVPLVNQRRNFYKLGLPGDQSSFMDTESVKRLPAVKVMPTASLMEVNFSESENWLAIRFGLTDRVPFRVSQSDDSRLEVILFNTEEQPGLRLPDQANGQVRRITTRTRGQRTIVVQVQLRERRLWGYRSHYRDDALYLDIRRNPLSNSTTQPSLRELKIIVDAGHGGRESGGVGSTGLLEKAANLDLAKKVSGKLKVSGASVVLTRDNDSRLSLAERVELARAADADIFLSIHQNSIGPDVDPLRPRGATTYYTFFHAKALAETIYNRLNKIGLSGYGAKTAAFVVTRQSDFISVLIEGAFLTHPQDEMFLLDAAFRARMAEAITQGVVDFVQSQQLP